MVGEVSVSDCFEMSQIICNGYKIGAYDEINIAGTEFVSVLSQVPFTQQLLPFSPDEVEGAREVIDYDPDPEYVFNLIIPEYLAGIIYGVMCESAASRAGRTSYGYGKCY